MQGSVLVQRETGLVVPGDAVGRAIATLSTGSGLVEGGLGAGVGGEEAT